MTPTLWGSGDGLDAAVAEFTAGDDRRSDRLLLPWDVLASLAHVEGLAAAGVLSSAERERLVAGLRRAAVEVESGRLTVGGDAEDAHTALEHWLVAELGETAEKVHTGRSRNDQVLAALALYTTSRLLEDMDGVLAVVDALLAFGRRHRAVVMPGYTHLRRAMPSTVALWAAGYAEALLDDLGPLEAALDLADVSPLGSAAGYGVPLPLDPDLTARRLGLARARYAVTAAQLGRGKLEAVVLTALWTVARDLGSLAWDVVLFAAGEYGYFRIPRALATGSSMMPHKRNPDIFELLRGRAGVLCGLATQAMAVAGGLPGGYHRDLQLVKGPLMEGLESVHGMLEMAGRAVAGIEVDRAACASAVGGDLLATDEVYRRVREGEPFRRAYRAVAAEVANGKPVPELEPQQILAARRSRGSAGDPRLLGRISRAAATWRRRVGARRARLSAALAALRGEGPR
jgi:argininosuccinate lyase